MRLNIPKSELVILIDFLSESEEHLSGIEDRILKLEVSKDYELVNSIFRPIHTIKGSSSFLGLTQISKLTHEVETILDDIRKSRITEIGSLIIDVLLEAVDSVYRLLKNTAVALDRADTARDPVEIIVEEIPIEQTISKLRSIRGEEVNQLAQIEALQEEKREEPRAEGIDYAAIKYPAEMKDNYQQEAFEHLENIENILLELEQRPEKFDIYNDLFRSLHSIKGNTGVILSVIEDETLRQKHFLNKLRDLAHASESLVQYKRDNRVALTSAEIEMLLLALDFMKTMVNDFAENRASNVELEVFLEQLKRVTQAAEASQDGQKLKEIGGDSLAIAVSNSIGQSIEAFAAGIREVRDEQLRETSLRKMIRAWTNLKKIANKINHQELLKKAEEALGLLNFLTKGRDPAEDLIIKELESYLPFLQEKADRRKEQFEDRRKATLPPPPQQVVALDRGAEFKSGEKVIKVAQEKIDLFMNLIGELLVSKNNLNSLARDISMKYNIPEIANRVKDAAEAITRISDELQNNIMEIRMLPVANAFSRFPRMIRDLAKKLNKEIRLEISGEETELDKNIIEALNDPLVHLVRNSADHGIESPQERLAKGKSAEGVVQLKAFNQGQYVVIQIIDDGRGIDPQKIRNKVLERNLLPESELEKMSDEEVLNLIFLPGFSLAKEITDVSGRGVGMDVVKSNIERLGGEVAIESEVDRGTCISMKLPLTLAIGRGLEVEANYNRYYIPLEYIVETLKVSAENVYFYKGKMISVIRNEIIPVYYLAERLGYAVNGRREEAEKSIVVLNVRNQKLGVIVDSFHSESEYVIKPLSQTLGVVEGVTGAMITGEGKIHLILDPIKLF